ncbi:MAG: DUF389 domain-containing protein [Polaribacter sp.]|nr:DUF389 domain-containing protein [Polaribacter sp.]
MEEKTGHQETIEQSKEAVQKEVKGLFENAKQFLIELLDFRHDTDHEVTIEAIKKDIPFKGATAWILIFAVFIASIGLNANSTAVVIGAMLISPLMGPILGLGMSIAINDIDTLRKSLVNLFTMIVLSLLASFLVFKLFPLSEDTSELLGRVRPDIRDVLIAFFGGLALMVARTKKGTIASVIFGVAIATALMPPLCTAGYGLAIGNYSYFFGAMYLFLINTIFIGLATFLVLKLLSFPMLKYVNSAKRKRIAQWASVLAVLVMIPAIYTFVNVYKDSKVNNQITLYVKEVKGLKALQLIDHEKDLPTKTVYLNFFNEINEATHNVLENNLKNGKNYPDLSDFTLKIKGSDTKSFELITTAYKEKKQELQESKRNIAGLQKELEALKETVSALNQRIEQNAQTHNNKVIAFSRIAKDAKIRYHEIEQIGFANVLSSKDFIKIDTIPTLTISWNKKMSDSIVKIKEQDLKSWLQTELSLDTLFVRRVNK